MLSFQMGSFQRKLENKSEVSEREKCVRMIK